MLQEEPEYLEAKRGWVFSLGIFIVQKTTAQELYIYDIPAVVSVKKYLLNKNRMSRAQLNPRENFEP